MKELTFDYDKTIRSHFPEESGVLICLFPFYTQIFVDHYPWEANLKQTFPLLSTITWKEVSKDIGFNSLNRLAHGILGLKEPFKTELNEYCEWKKIDTPGYADDKIPEVVIIPLVRYLKANGSTSITTKALERFPNSTNLRVDFGQRDEFDIYKEIQNAKHIETKGGLEILLPDYDCPYAIILGKMEDCMSLATSCDFECFAADSKTRFDWWTQ